MSVRRFQVYGTVQGVGFRPFVYRTAKALGLDGWVANVDGHVEGEVAGDPDAIDEFAARLATGGPVLARVRRVRLTEGHSPMGQGFCVRAGPARLTRTTPREIPPDAAICATCLRELYDPADRRHRYPFINCTDCGPRATIIEDHHAHVAAVAAEHAVRGPFLGVAYDGLGLGDDGTLWGGEILVADLCGYRRVGRFATSPLPGGDAAVRHPSRTALGHLLDSEPLGAPRPRPRLYQGLTNRLDPAGVRAVRAMVARGINCPRASSAGRLFDTVASLLGLADTVCYEGEAAVLLEAAAGTVSAVPLAHRIVRTDGLWVYDSTPTVTDLLDRRTSGESVAQLAAAFHLALARATADLVARAVEDGAPRTVCLGGGCFVNARLLTEVRRLLRAQGLRVLVGGEAPVGDGGISYGQAAVAAARLAEEER
ncbi:Kae1-like domain-containing protein [Streptomyces poonensis]|uniref:acylphosphatase n=1 Tax=Streptomyces poonensis TaxID=68255 RepID=A0A918UM18_9ACTN|nr:acylphosphatase [Streptomyces poonensis]GGZ20035.1 hypothetical protein GCM10010365_45390 [Streptomyces poonensis]